MFSKRNFNEDSSSEEDESRRKKAKSTPLQSFRICSSVFVDSSNRGERKMVKIPLDVLFHKSEQEIRDILITELPQLRGISFAFFAKDKPGKRYFCPCSLHCEVKYHSPAEWNGKNIRHAAPGNRAVWILIEGVTQVPSTGENIVPESGYETNVTESSTIAPSVDPSLRLDLDLQDEGVTEVPSTSENIVPERHLERCCETNLTESSTTAPSVYGLDPSFRLDLTDEELQKYHIDSPTTTLLMEIIESEDLSPQPTDQIPEVQDAKPEETHQGATQGNQHARIVIREIVPKEGDIAGGDTFILILTECCMVNDVKVQFGYIDPIAVSRISVTHFQGTIPPSPTPGPVQVQFLSLSGESITEKTVTFTYTTENAMENIETMNMDELQKKLIEIVKQMSQRSSDSKEETSQPGKPGTETQALALLRMIVDTAAKINAMDFFRILFSTQVARSVFKSFKDEQPLLEEIARSNGHEKLACLLEQKHSMYQDDESESDDEVDWKELAKAIETYQTLNDETAEKRSIQSTGSSELKLGYLGDAESSTSLSSSQVSVGFEDTFEEQQTTPQSECQEEPDTCSTVYILEDEAANSETSTNIPQGDDDDINCIATDLSQMSLLDESEMEIDESQQGIASKNLLQKGQKAVTQTSEESVSNVCVNEPSSEPGSRQHSRPFAYQLLVANQKERKSVCLPLTRNKVQLAVLLGFLMALCFVGISFIVQAIKTTTTTTITTTTTTTTAATTTAATTTMTSTTREACSNGPSALHCEAARNVNAVVDVEWKVKVPGIEWITFCHCNNQLGRCIVTRPMLTKGIKVLNSSLDTVTLQRVVENKTNDHARIMCQVHYLNYPLKVNIYEIHFSATCVWIPKGRDVNLTRILLNVLSCERVIRIDLCSINGNRFAYCNSCQGCAKTNSTDGNHLVPVFWNRLQVKRGSLLLTGIQENDDGLTIKVKVHMQTPRRDNGTNMVYTLMIFVNSSRGFPENKTLPTASAKLDGVGANFPCKPEQIRVNDTVGKRYTCWDCPVCNPGSQSSVACGSSVKLGTLIHCIPCNLGKTYSDKNDKSQCKVEADDDCTRFMNHYWNGTQCVGCSRCPPGFGVKTTCSSKQDTECQPCWPGYDYSNNTGFEPCILCNQYSNCLEGNAKKIKNCTIFSPTICEGCADGNFFDSSYGNNGECVECSSPCSTFEDEARPCSTAHDRTCKPSTDSAKEIPNIGGTSSEKTPSVIVLVGGAIFILIGACTIPIMVLLTRLLSLKKHIDSKGHARTVNARGNDIEMRQRTPLIKSCADNGLDLPIKDLTIVGKRFIARMLNDKDCYGYFYWEIIAEKLGLFEECKAWEGVENPSEKLLTAYGEKEGSTIRYLIKALREVGVIHFADEIERFFITCYQDSANCDVHEILRASDNVVDTSSEKGGDTSDLKSLALSDISLDPENTLVNNLDVRRRGEYGCSKLGSAFGVDKVDLNYLETAYKRDGGSPTIVLLDILNTQGRTVADLINALKSPKVDRPDIALQICQLIRSERK